MTTQMKKPKLTTNEIESLYERMSTNIEQTFGSDVASIVNDLVNDNKHYWKKGSEADHVWMYYRTVAYALYLYQIRTTEDENKIAELVVEKLMENDS
jgi:hypothetical protein